MRAPWIAVVRVQHRVPLFQIVALVALFLYGAMTIEGFSTEQSVRSMLVLAALLGLAAAGQTLVMIVGGLDLSVPGFIVAGAAVVTELCGSHGWPLLPAVVFVAGAAAALGGAAGWICHRFVVQPLIVTLGIGAIALGASLVWTSAQLDAVPPQLLSDLTAANGTTAGLPVSPVVVIWIAFAILLQLLLHRTVTGRRIFATGANVRAAELTLVPTRRVWTVVFSASAVLSALVGVLLAGFAGSDPSLGDPYLFQGLTAVVIGGTAIGGARGDYAHTVVGALILTVLTTILVGRGYDAADQQIIFGVLILLVVAAFGRERAVRDDV